MKKHIPAVAMLLVVLPVALSLGGSAFGEEGDLSRDAKKLYDTALRSARARTIKDQQKRLLTKAWDKVDTADLGRVIARLRQVEEPPRSFPEVLALLVSEHLHRRFGDEPMREIEHLVDRIADRDPAVREALLVESLALADLRFARHLALQEARAEEPGLRRRAALCLGDLVNYGADDGNESGSLVALLDDPDTGVRAVAARRAFEVRLDEVFAWALQNLEDQRKATIRFRGEEVTVAPGEEALRGLAALTRIQDDLLHRRSGRGGAAGAGRIDPDPGRPAAPGLPEDDSAAEVHPLRTPPGLVAQTRGGLSGARFPRGGLPSSAEHDKDGRGREGRGLRRVPVLVRARPDEDPDRGG
jgi:hypothetical protein